MILNRADLPAFAIFLREEYNAKPMLRSGDNGELLRAILGCDLLIVLDLNPTCADVWCSDENRLDDLRSQWSAYRELVG